MQTYIIKRMLNGKQTYQLKNWKDGQIYFELSKAKATAYSLEEAESCLKNLQEVKRYADGYRTQLSGNFEIVVQAQEVL